MDEFRREVDYIPRGEKRERNSETFLKRVQKRFLDWRVRFVSKFYDPDAFDNIYNDGINYTHIIYTNWTRKPQRKRIVYGITGILFIILCYKIWWNVNYENLEISDNNKKLILNAFGSNSYDFLNHNEDYLKEVINLDETVELVEESKFFDLGYLPVYILERGVKNITFDKILTDTIEESKKVLRQEGCFCAAELGLSLNAIYVWRISDQFDKKTEYIELYSPRVTFNSDTLYHGTYKLGSFTCSEKINVVYLSPKGESVKELFSHFLSMCICACNDFIERFSKIKPI